MPSYWQSSDGAVRLFLGKCEQVLPLVDYPLHACVTDPPFGIEWLGNKWDREIPPVSTWTLIRKVLAPGAVLLAMGKPKTYHRLGCAIEDAGFEISDALVRLYGSGRPPSKRHPRPAAEFICIARTPPVKGFPALPGLNPENARLPRGRWPTNVILSHSPNCTETVCVRDCPVFLLDNQTGILTSGKMRKGTRRKAHCGYAGGMPDIVPKDTIADSGGASRFFYCSRTSPKERQRGGNHPAAKPLSVMRWLCSLLDIPDEEGVILDPFMGGGTTAEAAILEGKRFVGIEQEEKYFEAAVTRVKRALEEEKEKA